MADHTAPVLVIGATGQQGGATARHLLQRGRPVRALVRDPHSPAAGALRAAGASLVAGDLDDPASLRAAMDGVHGVFLVLTMMAGPRISPEGVIAEERAQDPDHDPEGGRRSVDDLVGVRGRGRPRASTWARTCTSRPRRCSTSWRANSTCWPSIPPPAPAPAATGARGSRRPAPGCSGADQEASCRFRPDARTPSSTRDRARPGCSSSCPRRATRSTSRNSPTCWPPGGPPDQAGIAALRRRHDIHQLTPLTNHPQGA